MGLLLGNTDFQLPPKIFYGVEIWKLARPLQDLEMLLTKPLLRCVWDHCHAERPSHVSSSMPLLMEGSFGGVHGHAVVGEQGVQERAQNAPLWGSSVEDQRGGDVFSYPHHLGAAHQKVQDPIAQGRVETQGHKLNDEFGALWF